jgi:hypothetical protein
MEKTTTDEIPPPTFDKNEEEYERLAGKEPGHYQFNKKVSTIGPYSKANRGKAHMQYANGFRDAIQSQDPSPAFASPA